MACADLSGYGDVESPQDVFPVSTGDTVDGDATGVLVTGVFDNGEGEGYDVGDTVELTVGDVVGDSVGLVATGVCCCGSAAVVQKEGLSTELAHTVS